MELLEELLLVAVLLLVLFVLLLVLLLLEVFTFELVLGLLLDDSPVLVLVFGTPPQPARVIAKRIKQGYKNDFLVFINVTSILIRIYYH